MNKHRFSRNGALAVFCKPMAVILAFFAWVLPYQAQAERCVTYTIKIETGDVKGAGTNSNVELQIVGTGGDYTKSLDFGSVNGLISGNAFERGDVDVITTCQQDIGYPSYIVLRSNHKGIGADWYVDRVTMISDTGNNNHRGVFEIHKWFTSSSQFEYVVCQYCRWSPKTTFFPGSPISRTVEEQINGVWVEATGD